MKKPKSFNNEHYDSIYAKWYEHFDKLEMSRFYRVNESKTEIIICGIFKITKNKNKISLKRFSFESQKWTSNFSQDTNIFHFKLFQISIKKVYSSIMKESLNELLRQFKIIEQYGSSKITSWQVKRIFVDTKLKFAENKQNIAKAFLKELHDNFIDKNVYSFTQKIFQTIPSIKQYLYIQRLDFKSLQRIEIEHKNLLPIVAYLSPSDIRDPNIFSKKYWVTQGVTFNGYYKNMNKYDHAFTKEYKSSVLLTLPHWRFIKSLRVTNIAYLFNVNWLDKSQFEILSKINDLRKQQTKIVNAFIALVSKIYLFHGDVAETKRYVIFFNALLKEILKRKQLLKKDDFKNFIKFFISKRNDIESISASTLYNQIYDIKDFLSEETPDLNKNSTFNSILNATRKWERSIYLSRINDIKEVRTWESSPINYQYDNFTVKEINNEYELATEGYEMHHCVATYTEEALNSQYKIFSIKDNNNKYERATLGVKRTRIGWETDQIRGYCNAPIFSEDILLICKDIVYKINNKDK